MSEVLFWPMVEMTANTASLEDIKLQDLFTAAVKYATEPGIAYITIKIVG